MQSLGIGFRLGEPSASEKWETDDVLPRNTLYGYHCGRKTPAQSLLCAYMSEEFFTVFLFPRRQE